MSLVEGIPNLVKAILALLSSLIARATNPSIPWKIRCINNFKYHGALDSCDSYTIHNYWRNLLRTAWLEHHCAYIVLYRNL